jgi:hypothetical protein
MKQVDLMKLYVSNDSEFDGDIGDEFLIFGRDILNIMVKRSYTYNNTQLVCDIIGDPRKFQDRVEHTVTDSDETIDIKKNMYILCNDATNNGGTAGHLYRYLGDDITGVHTNSIDGDANASDGHIDFSDDAKWVDLGDDLTKGGYPVEWLEKGFAGTPLLVGEDGSGQFPIDAWKNGDVAHSEQKPGYNSDYKYIGFKLSKKGIQLKQFLVRAKDGSWVKYDFSGSVNDLSVAGGTGNNTIDCVNHIFFNIGNANTLSALGYSDLQEALDNIVVLAYYEAYTNVTELSNCQKVYAIGDGWAGNYYGPNWGAILMSNLINKIPVSNNSTGVGTVSQKFKIEDYSLREGDSEIFNPYNWGVKPSHKHLTFATQQPTYPTVKVLPYLTQLNNRAEIGLIFKEIRFDSNGNGGDDNKFNIVDKVSTTTDTNNQTVLIGQKKIKLDKFLTDEDI